MIEWVKVECFGPPINDPAQDGRREVLRERFVVTQRYAGGPTFSAQILLDPHSREIRVIPAPHITRVDIEIKHEGSP